MAKPRRKIDNPDAAAALIVQTGFEQRAVVKITLLAAGEIGYLHREMAAAQRVALAAEQAAKYWIAIETRKTCPDHASCAIDQCADLTVPDQP
jgi:hypothetical protein